MRRWVPIPVDDERVTHLFIEHNDETRARPNGDGPAVVKAQRVPVSQDDQLTRDVAMVTAALGYIRQGSERGRHMVTDMEARAAVRLRAYFKLDTESG